MAGMKPPKFKKVQPNDYSKSMEMEQGPTPRKITFFEDELPIKDWKVGEEYQIVINVRQVEAKIKDYGPRKGKHCAEFELLEVAEHVTEG